MPSILLSDNGVSSGSAGLKSTADSSGVLALQTTTGSGVATTAVTIDTSQNVGVGVTPSAWGSFKALELANGSYFASYTGGGNFTEVGVNNYFDGGSWRYKNSDYAVRYVQTSGQHQFFTSASGTAGNAITWTQAMTLDASGNLAVGSSSVPRGRLYVNSASSANCLAIQSNTTGVYLEFADYVTPTWTNSPKVGAINNDLLFSTNGSERARIDSSGNLLVGTTANGVWGGNCWGMVQSGGFTLTGHANGTASGTTYSYFYYNNGNIGSITQNGTTGVLYNITSDYRLKDNPEPVTGAKDFVMALQPKTWDWHDGSGKGVGFIAHEFMEVAKHSGNGEKDAVDENGNPVYQSIQPSSSEVIANLVAHIQNLETRLAALENK